MATKKKTHKEEIPAGTVVSLQGEPLKAFQILHSGMVEVLICPDPTDNISGDGILEGSFRCGLIKGEALLGLSGSRHSPPPFSIRTLSDCIISSTPLEMDDPQQQILTDERFGVAILRDMVRSIESILYLSRNYKYLLHKYASIADSLALGANLKKNKGKEEKDRAGASLEGYSQFLKSRAAQIDGSPPSPWDYNLFLGQLQDRMELYAEMDDLCAEERIDHRQYLFIKRIVEKDDKILAALFHRDEPMSSYIFGFLAETLNILQDFNLDLARRANSLINRLFDEKGWASQVIALAPEENRQARNFLHYLTVFSRRCRKDSQNLLGLDIFKEYPVFASLRPYLGFAPPPEAGGRAAAGSHESLRKYGGLLDRLLDFSGLDEEFRRDYKQTMDSLLDGDNLSSKEGKALRQKASQGFWVLYEHCFLKIIDSDLKGFLPGILLHMGVVDERFLSEEDLLSIDRLYAVGFFSHDVVPVMTLPYFLEKIYRSEISPSINEMGDSFDTVLKMQEKMTPKEKAKARLFEKTPEDRVRFELRNIAGDLSRILFGHKDRALPFLCSALVGKGAERFFLDPDALASEIEKIRERDFSLFYREVLISHKLGKDFVQKEQPPCFILYPGLGSRAVMWQEMDGTKKDSRGRIFFPLFFTEDKRETLITQLAYFRWELRKTIAGYNWTDPVEGGLVGAYYDYISFFKKNPKLSLEARGRLNDFIKQTKSDKDRFAIHYGYWIDYEYEGKIRLDQAAREIFYRFCPYPRERREKMAEKPSFQDLEMKYQNRRQGDILKLKSRILAFEKKKAPLPGEMEHYRDFLEL